MRGKIGIFATHQVGDVITATAVLKYKDKLWPDKDIIWFCCDFCADALKFSPVAEIRLYDGNRDAGKLDYLKKNMGVGLGSNRLDMDRAKEFQDTADLEDGYFPLTWMVTGEQRQGMPYPMVSKSIFGVTDINWRPCLWFSDAERNMVAAMVASLPHKKTVMIENSPCNYSPWGDSATKLLMTRCRSVWGPTNFIFASGGNRSGNDMMRFFDDPGCISGASLTARQASLLNEHSDLFVGLAGALTFSTSCWGAKPTPKLIYTGSEILGARDIANGRIEVIASEHHLADHEQEFEKKLTKLLSEGVSNGRK